jgi:hypothetical protein
MIEKKKRGRPRKETSGLKFKAPSAKDKKRILAERNTVTDFKAPLPMLPEECFDVDRLDVKIYDEPGPLIKPSERHYPKDWDAMSKVEKLKYLTANPR